jgi:hypothetical protein
MSEAWIHNFSGQAADSSSGYVDERLSSGPSAPGGTPSSEEAGARSATPPTGIAGWPTVLGVVAGIAVGFSGELPAIVMVCAAIYLVAAVAGRPNAAWIGFVASIPFVGIGRVLDQPWVSLAAIGSASLILIIVGGARGVWRARDHRRQLFAMALFSTIAVAAVTDVDPLIAGILVIVGLLGHAAWDVWHHLRKAVVAQSYAEFCAVLDVILAIVIAVTLVVDAVAR